MWSCATISPPGSTRRSCALDAEDDCFEYYINDLESTNGTFLNGSRVMSQQLLQDGDKIKIGNYLLKFAMLDEFEAEFQERLHQMTQRDELTGLKSRRSLFADLDRVVSQAQRSDEPKPVVGLDGRPGLLQARERRAGPSHRQPHDPRSRDTSSAT